MSDFFQRVDVSGLGVGYTVEPTCLFGTDGREPLETRNQDVINESGVEVIYVSFDGRTDHGQLGTSGVTVGHSWTDHPRDRLWLRRSATGGAAQYVQVYAYK